MVESELKKFSMADLEQAKKEFDEAQTKLENTSKEDFYDAEWRKALEARDRKQDHFEAIRKALQGELGRRFDKLLEEQSEIYDSDDVDAVLDEAKKEILRDMNGGDEDALFKTLIKWFGDQVTTGVAVGI